MSSKHRVKKNYDKNIEAGNVRKAYWIRPWMHEFIERYIRRLMKREQK